MSKDKKKSGKKGKSQAEAVVDAMSNVTGHAQAAQKALKAGKKLAKEQRAPEPSEHAVEGEKPEWGAALDAKRAEDQKAGANEKVMRILRKQRVKDAQKGNMDLDWNEPNLTLEAKPRQVEVVEPVAEKELSKKERKAREAEVHRGDGFTAVAQFEADHGGFDPEPNLDGLATPTGRVEAPVEHPETRSLTAPTNVGVSPEPVEPLADVTTEDQGGVPTSAEPRTRTDNLLVMLKQAQESADLDNRTQSVTCPRRYVTKNYGVQLVKKYAAEGIFAEATEDTFVPPDRDHPKGMWEVTLKVHPNKNSGSTQEAESEPEVPATDSLVAPDGQRLGKVYHFNAEDIEQANKLLKKGIKKAKKKNK